MATNAPKATSSPTASTGKGSSTSNLIDEEKSSLVELVLLLESMKGLGRDVVFIDGVRTPFLQSFTAYKDLMGYHLARHALL